MQKMQGKELYNLNVGKKKKVNQAKQETKILYASE